MYKFSFPIEEGAHLLAAADPFGVLGEGEVFVAIQRENEAPQVISGRDVVHRIGMRLQPSFDHPHSSNKVMRSRVDGVGDMPTVMNKDVPLGNLAYIIVINFMSLGVHDRSERVLASDCNPALTIPTVPKK